MTEPEIKELITMGILCHADPEEKVKQCFSAFRERLVIQKKSGDGQDMKGS